MTSKRPHKHIDTPPDLLLSSETTYFASIDSKRRCHGHPLTFPFAPGSGIRGVEGTLDAHGRVRDACGNDVDGFYSPQGDQRRGAVDFGPGLSPGLSPGLQGGERDFGVDLGAFGTVSIFGSICSSPAPSSPLPASTHSTHSTPPLSYESTTTAPTSADGEDEAMDLDLDTELDGADAPATQPFALERGSPRRPTIPLPPLHDDSLAPDVARWAGGLSALDGMGIDLSPSPSPSPSEGGSRSTSPAHYPASPHNSGNTFASFAFQPFPRDMPPSSGAPPSCPLPPLPALPAPLPAVLGLPPLSLGFDADMALDDSALTTASLDSAGEAALWEAEAAMLAPRRRRRAMSVPLRPGAEGGRERRREVAVMGE